MVYVDALCDVFCWGVLSFLSFQVIRYNRLLGVVHQSLQDLLKALKGLVVMSQALETMANSLYNNAVPGMWAAKVRSSEDGNGIMENTYVCKTCFVPASRLPC